MHYGWTIPLSASPFIASDLFCWRSLDLISFPKAQMDEAYLLVFPPPKKRDLESYSLGHFSLQAQHSLSVQGQSW